MRRNQKRGGGGRMNEWNKWNDWLTMYSHYEIYMYIYEYLYIYSAFGRMGWLYEGERGKGGGDGSIV